LTFTATGQTGGARRYISDGTDLGTIVFLPAGAGQPAFAGKSFEQLGGQRWYFFGVGDGDVVSSLFRTEGTPGDSVKVFADLTGFEPDHLSFRRVGEVLYFAAGRLLTNGGFAVRGVELWKTDGTEAGTAEVADIHPGQIPGSNPSQLVNANGVLFFTADDGIHGRELWRVGDPVIVSTDLQISIFATPSFVTTGDAFSYRITVSNVGVNVASPVAVTATLPAGFVVTDCVAPLGTCSSNGAGRTIGFPSIGAGDTRTVTITGTVTASAGATLSSAVVVSSATADVVASNDSATLATTVSQPDDVDADDRPDEWERRFGLQTGSGSGDNGRLGDPDGDGRTNLQELTDGTHPRGTFGRFLSEGATSSFFRTRISLLNPRPSAARVLLRFLKGDGTTVSKFVELAPRRRGTVEPHLVPGLEAAEFSTSLESDGEVVVDRTMTWGEGYGSHAESGVPTPAPIWYLAEGSTVGPFNLFYLLQNPSLTTSATVRVSFLLPTGAPLEKTFVVPANSRQNIWVDAIDELKATDVSAILTVTSGPDIIVERAMYLDRPGQPFAAGHESAGITAPSLNWFFAEGATGRYFDEFILIANPNATTIRVHATFLLPSGQTLTKDYSIAGNSRFNIWVDEETFDGAGKPLQDTAVSVTLTGLDGTPFIAERSMWWPGPTSDTWAEAHNSAGATATGQRWALADGEVGGSSGTDTYILIANTSAVVAQVEVTLLLEDGRVLKTATPFDVAPRSRFNVWVKAEFPDAEGQRFGAIVESVGPTPAELVVERAMYSNAGGVVWAAGTNALATKLQ
jgi:uncharacterized repeat protein (TIGR01451 family)